MVEFWLSGTFAVIVARFVAGHRLSRRVVSIMTLLYLMAVAFSLSRVVLVGARSFEYRARLLSMGFEEFYTPQLGFVGGGHLRDPTLRRGGLRRQSISCLAVSLRRTGPAQNWSWALADSAT